MLESRESQKTVTLLKESRCEEFAAKILEVLAVEGNCCFHLLAVVYPAITRTLFCRYLRSI